MAKFNVRGLQELNAELSRIESIPDEVLNKMLESMGAVAIKQIRKSGEDMDIRDPSSNVHILDSLKLGKIKKLKDGARILVNFSGTRTRNGKKTRNAVIAYVNEFGRRNMRARPFVSEALRKGADEISQAGADVFYSWLDGK